MLEKETDTILAVLTERTIGRRDEVTLKEALAADMPRGVKTYVQAEVIRWLKTDLAVASRFGRVNMSAPGIAQLTSAFLRSLAQGYSFSRTEFLSVLTDAVHFTGNYLCRPQWTLCHFLFDTAPTLTPAELFSGLGYTADYSYLRRLIERAVRQWNWKEVTAENFRDLLAKVDGQVVRQHSAMELALLTRPIYEFLAKGQMSRNVAIPLDPILVFFDDKKMTNVKTHIENICKIRGRSELTQNELASLIEDVSIASPGATASQKVGQKPPASRTGPGAPAPPGAGEPGTPAPPGEAGHAIHLVPDSAPAPGPHEPKAPPAHEQALPDLQTLITEKERARFVKRLFKKDDEYYFTFLGELNSTSTWKEATVLLNRFYQENSVDPFSEEAVEFTDAVQARYLARPQ